MAKKKSVSKTERESVISALLNRASTFAGNGGCVMVQEAVAALCVLDEPRPAQLKSTIGLIDGQIELNGRFSKAAAEDRQGAAEEEGDDDPNEVCETKAVGYKGSQLDAALTKARVNLDAALILLSHGDSPTADAGQVPVPTSMATGAPQDRTGRVR